MPKLSLRQVGSSHMIEGLANLDVDAQSLRSELEAICGPALGVVAWTPPKTLTPADLQTISLIQAVIIDRKAMTADELRDWLTDWARRHGWGEPVWHEAQSPAGAIAILDGDE